MLNSQFTRDTELPLTSTSFEKLFTTNWNGDSVSGIEDNSELFESNLLDYGKEKIYKFVPVWNMGKVIVDILAT